MELCGILWKITIFAAESARQRRGKVSLNNHSTMAIMQGITGKVSGKMGSAVFRVRNGAQVVTQYNPIVKNPNSEGQQAARAKFKLLSQLGSIMEAGFGTLGVTKRAGKSAPSQRNAFMQLNYPLVSVSTENDDSIQAKIPMEQVKLTSSWRNLGTISKTENTVTISDIPAEVASVRFVEVGYVQFQEPDGIGGFIIKTRGTILRIVDVPVSNNTSVLEDSDFGSTVLAYGLIPTETTGTSIDLDSIHTPSDEKFISAVNLDAMVRAGQMAETMTLGINIPSPTQG